jgi:hypothetical protein
MMSAISSFRMAPPAATAIGSEEYAEDDKKKKPGGFSIRLRQQFL